MIITQTPLRISFLGGNTDFREFFHKHGGCVLSTAIDKYVYCTLHRRFDDKIYVNWSKKEIVDDVDQIEHELVREAMKKVGVYKGLEISFYADVPSEGSGLGSSSSVTVGVLNALHQYKGEAVGAEQLAQEACEIEIDILKKPIGIQDQYAAAFGGFRFYTYYKSGQVTSEKLDLDGGLCDDLDNSLMMFFTGRTRTSSQILGNVKAGLTQNNHQLLATKKLAMEGYQRLKRGDILSLGKLMHQYWLLKKGLAENITNPEIDSFYQKALEAGAVGGKIAGAGGGGFLLLMVPSEKRDKVRKALKNYRELPFRIGVGGSRVIFNL